MRAPAKPRRYWLPEMKGQWRADPLYEMAEQDRRVMEEIERLDRGGSPGGR